MKRFFALVVTLLMALSPCCQGLATGAEAPGWLPESWDYEADVVICGFGAAGTMGAKEAIENGASCLVLEKAPEAFAGGATSCSGGYVNPTPKEQFLEYSQGYLNDEESETLAAENLKSVAWLKSCGFAYINDWGKSYGAGSGYYKLLSDAVKACGANVMYETAAKKLIFDPATKEVFGVIAQGADGKALHIKANKGVLLATGAMVGSEDLLHRLWLAKGITTFSANSPYNTGDGFRMAMDVNAAITNVTSMSLELTSFSMRKASEEMGTAIQLSPDGETAQAMLFVNGSGSRFMNEATNMGHYKGVRTWLDYPGDAQFGYRGYVNQPMYMICDAKFFNETKFCSQTMDCYWASAKGLYHWSADNQAELERGWIAKGDTLEELASNLCAQSGQPEMDVEGLKASIAAYNKACTAGVDPYGRANALPVDTAPYYAVELCTTLCYSLGGLQTGLNGETLNWDGEHIPGLYHAGDIGQVITIMPQGVVTAMSFGARAVRAMCGSEKRDIPGQAAQVIAPHTPEQQALAANGVHIDMTGYVTPAEAALGIAPYFPVAAEKATMTPGTYEAVAQGRNGDIRVVVTVSETEIKEIAIKEHSETAEIATAAIEELPAAIVNGQSLKVDAVAGATATSSAIVGAVRDCLVHAGGNAEAWQ